MNVRILLFFCAMAFGAPTKLNAVPENDFPARETALAEFMAEKFIISTFQGFGNKRLSWGVIPGDKALPPVVISVGLGESYKHYEEFLYDLWADGTNKQAVFIFDLRSQGFSDRTSEDMTVMHVDSFDDYANDLEIFLDTIVRPEYPLPARVMGHSTGGLIAFLVLAKRPDLAENAIFVAPLFGFNYGSIPTWIIETYAGFLSFIGFHAKPIPFRSSSGVPTFAANKLTYSEVRFNRIFAVQELLPKPVPTGPSVGFITSGHAAFKKAIQLAPKFSTPSELLTADEDVYVSTESAVAICKLMQQCKLTAFNQTRHVMLHERDEVRSKVMDAIRNFLIVQPGS